MGVLNMNVRSLAPILFVCLLISATVNAQGTRLLRHPTVNRDSIAFEYAGDVWIVSRSGGQARRLTATPGAEIDPYFSPDGSQIAFTATVAGNTDVFVVPTTGGDPKRLTFHPGLDRARGWTPDGRRVIFASNRTSAPQQSYFRLWSISVEGGFPDPLPMPRAFSAAYSADGKRIAYDELTTAFIPDWYETSMWRHYRGGRTHPIAIMNLADYSLEKIPWSNSNDTIPMWIGNTVYFLSDRNYTVNLFSYRVDTKQLTQLTRHDDFDVMTASAGSDAVVYEQAGYIYLVDAGSGRARKLDIQVTGDLPWARPQFKKVVSMIRNSALSPTGIRAAFEARGEIFTVPTDKGDYRNLTQSSGAHDRSPVWSPDGSQLAWLSDASGEYQLMIGDPLGVVAPRAVPLPSTAFYSAPSWSPDGTQILLQDNHDNLWMMEIASGKAVKLDTDEYADPVRSFDAVWAPDSKWIAYSKNLPSHLRAIFVYSLAEKKSHQITDGLADSISPAFDVSGKYLYFMASTNYGPSAGWLEMSSIDRPVRRAIYLAVLNASEPSPFLPESGDEPKPTPTPDPQATPQPAPPAPRSVNVRIDFDRINQRILAISLPSADYSNLTAGSAGSFYYTEPIVTTAAPAGPPNLRLQRYQVKERTAAPFLEGIRSYSLSADKKKLLYQASAGGGASWGVVATDRPSKVGDGPIGVAQLEMRIEPRAEWEQIFRETWRIQREHFYDAKFHGNDWDAIYEKYRPLLAFVGHRADLGYLIATVGGELAVGHSYLSAPGDVPGEDPVAVGLLGADYAIENGRYRIKKIYSGENWNPDLRAPLSAPGIQVSEGDYLLEVNGRPLNPPMSIYRIFEGTAGRQTIIRVNKTPSMEGSRVVTVVPVPNEDGLRTRAWIEDNRRTVDKLSNGRLAYVWLPNTAGPGYTYFTRYYYSQQDKEGAVIDERYNHGGQVADYIVNELDRKLMGYFAQRDGQPATSPIVGLYGPKVMIINESAGSGGDALPYMFRLRKIGPLVGTRTWGGLVGTLGVPPTIDGGGITAPNLAFYDLSGKWAVENEGVAPDIEVEYIPADVIRGHDPQLERAVQEALKLLEQNPWRRVPRPAPINRISKQTRASDQ
ncbi:MAG TPA: PDZ domain-containing protein [Pyrinomonadaceae bacterium]|nr:PDZ domain-containing protein [Pyrinomonadaceae bacterium]